MQGRGHKLQGPRTYTEAVPDALPVPDMQAGSPVPPEPGAPKEGAVQQVRQPDLLHQRRQVREAAEKDRIHALGVGGEQE